jgi:hypothetical protein
VFIEAADFLVAGDHWRCRRWDNATITQHTQQMGASRAKVRPGSKGWTRTIAQRQVPIQEAVDCLFIELINGEAALTHPPPEVRDAGNVIFGALDRISALN